MNDFMLNGRSYRRQFRKCGKDGCKCNTGDEADMHGPYWYFTSDYGGLKYVGKNLPADIIRVLELIKSERPRLAEIRQQAQERAEAARRDWEYETRNADTIDALIRGQQADPRVLRALELEEFIFE